MQAPSQIITGQKQAHSDPAQHTSQHGMLVFQAGRLVYANHKAAEMIGGSVDELLGLTEAAYFAFIAPEHRQQLAHLHEIVLAGELAPIQPEIDLIGRDGLYYRVDMLVNLTLYQGQAALQVNWIDVTPRRQAEVMRDAMAALASAADMSQALEVILLNLRNLIRYDRAGLFLLDENKHYVLAEKFRPGQEHPPRSFLGFDPIVEEMQQTRRPLVVNDLQADARFDTWPDMQSVRAWIGAPLYAGPEMIGFISLGSLEAGAFGELEAATIQAFTEQVAEVLEKAWQEEQTHRRTEELEVLSTISFALGQAESRENTLSAIIEQVIQFFGAASGALLFPDQAEEHLTVKYSSDASLTGLRHSRSDDLLWQVYQNGQLATIRDGRVFVHQNRHQIYRLLLRGVGSAALIPLKAQGGTFGILYLAFENRRNFSGEDLNLYNAIADIAGASLRRTVILEALEKQVDVRTEHLNTLYNINAVAGQPLELQALLEQVLKITLEAMKSSSGAIHLIGESGQELHLVAWQNLTEEFVRRLKTLRLRENFWKDLVSSSTPLMLLNLDDEPGLPEEMRLGYSSGSDAYLGTPIKAKGQPLGLVSIFGHSMLDYSIEDMTLFMTIADQLGYFVERARLIEQAGQAAVIEERQRLARELHDSITQLLYSQVLFAGASRKVLSQGNLELLEQHLKRIDQAALQALREMRLLVYELRPVDYLEEGLMEALRRRLASVEKRTGINAYFSVEGELILDDATEMALYRISQEALNNTLKHSGATEVSVRLLAEPESLSLEITDNGFGFDLPEKLKAGGMGLASIQERAEEIGGQVEIQTAPGQGTRIIVKIEGLE